MLSPAAFADKVKPSTSELFNGKRIYVGVSEAAGVLENFYQVVSDGVEREFFHPKMGEKVTALWEKHDLATSVRQLNSAQYPAEPRSEASLTKAVENFMRFSTAVRQEWSFFSELACRSTCAFVDSTWILQVAMLTHPAKMASHVKDVDTLSSKDKLLERPGNAKALRDFLVAECLAGHGIRTKAKPSVAEAAASSAPVPDLDFGVSDDEDAPTKTTVQELQQRLEALTSFTARKRKHGADKEAKLAALQALYDSVTEEFGRLGVQVSERVIKLADLKTLFKQKRTEVRALSD
jgi:hypothetical protein